MEEARAERSAGLVLSRPVVRAGGGVVVRRADDGATELLLVHRPRYDDWSFPKGKALPGEGDEECALREVEEETGLRCVLEDALPSASYRDAKGRQKVVRYWRMRVVDGDARPRAEVDETRWLSIGEAAQLLSYDHDRGVLAALAERHEG